MTSIGPQGPSVPSTGSEGAGVEGEMLKAFNKFDQAKTNEERNKAARDLFKIQPDADKFREFGRNKGLDSKIIETILKTYDQDQKVGKGALGAMGQASLNPSIQAALASPQPKESPNAKGETPETVTPGQQSIPDALAKTQKEPPKAKEGATRGQQSIRDAILRDAAKPQKEPPKA